MNAVLSWIKSHGPVHLAIVAIFTLPMAWLLSVVPNNGAPIASKVRIWFDGLENQTIDTRMFYGRKAEADPSLVLLAIDSASFDRDVLEDSMTQASPALAEMKNGYPFPRDIYAQTCDRLFSAGAKVVAFDLNFLNEKPEDPTFQQALDKYRAQVVIGLNFSDDGTSYQLPSPTLLPSQDPLDDRLGYFNFWKDPNDVLVRTAQYRNNNDYMLDHPGSDRLPILYSMAARVVQKAGDGELVPNDFLARPLRFARSFPTFSFYELFYEKTWNADFQHGEFFRGKIVVVGPAGDWSKDVFSTPLGLISGAELHLEAINALLHHEFLTPASNGLSVGVALLFAAAALTLAALIHSIAVRFGIALAFVAAYAGIGMWAYNGSGWLLPMVAPVFVFSGSVGVGFVYDFVVSQLERYRLRLTFERYNSKNVVKYLLAHPDSYKEMLVGTHRDVSVLFSDIRSFTTIVETAPDARGLVRKLNEYLTAMVDCVIRQDGNLEKFMGDGIMAVWGNTPYSAGPKDDAVRAVRAALAMTVELKRLNAKWLSEGRSEWKIGIGVNHGNVIVGDMGSPDHKEFAMVGDPVNLGSRLEGLTKEYHVQIMLGELLAELVSDVFYLRSVALVKVKGKNRAVKAFTLLGERKDGLPPEKEKFLQLYEEAMVAFRAQQFDLAQKLFESALEIEPDDYLAGDYRRSAMRYAEEPPPADWDGVRVMTEK